MAEFLARLRDPTTGGAAVTMPHKVAVLQHLDDITEDARDIGACNTVIVEEIEVQGVTQRRFVGANTDVIGIREAFLRNTPDPTSIYNRPSLVIGGGGAARSAVYALAKYFQASHIYIINRDASEVAALQSAPKLYGKSQLIHVTTTKQVDALVAPHAVVSCIPDLPPATEAEHQARGVIEAILRKNHKGLWLEMAYHPTVWTDLACLAKDAGWMIILGTEAMIWQGLEQDRLWTGRGMDDMPVATVKAVVARALG